MPHDDFSFLTGKQADLDNDGKVSFGEYMGGCVILTIVFLISWVICFLQQKKVRSITYVY